MTIYIFLLFSKNSSMLVTFSAYNDDLVDSDVSVGETSEQQVSTLVPCKTCASNGLGALFLVRI